MENYNNMPIIQWDKFELRTLQKKDAKDFYEFGRDPITTEFLTWGPFKSLKEAKSMIKYIYFRRLSRFEPIGYAIIDRFIDKMIGTIEFHTFNYKQNSCEIGYVLHKDYWNQGIMTSALKEVTQIGFDTLKLDYIIVKHIKENMASKRVIEKAGYTLKDVHLNGFFHPKTNRYHDVYTYELKRR